MANWPLEYRLLLCLVASLCVGSFLNLAIYRLAWNSRGISPWSKPPVGLDPRSSWDRLPVLGWLRLIRESHYWGPLFWVRPMLLEICFATGATLLYLYALNAEGMIAIGREETKIIDIPFIHSLFITHYLLLCLLVIVTFIDVDEKTIPDNITLPGTLLGLLLVTLNPWVLPHIEFLQPDNRTYISWTHFNSPNHYPVAKPTPSAMAWALGCLWLWIFALLPRFWHARYGIRLAWKYFWASLFCGRYRRQTFGLLGIGSVLTLGILYVWSQGDTSWIGLFSSLLGMACGTVLIWAIRIVGRVTLKREAMGFGDVTLMAMIGSFIGWQATLVVFFLAPLAGLAIGLIQLAIRREDEVPYGPFLCLATLVTVLWWPSFWDHLAPIFTALGSALPLLLLLCLALMALLLAGWAKVKNRLIPRGTKA